MAAPRWTKVLNRADLAAMPQLEIRHITKYRYRNPVSLGEHRIMLRPLESYDQHVLLSQLKISPQPSRLRYIHDVFGNCVALAQFDLATRELVVENPRHSGS